MRRHDGPSGCQLVEFGVDDAVAAAGELFEAAPVGDGEVAAAVPDDPLGLQLATGLVKKSRNVKRVLITAMSGAGKNSLLHELAARGCLLTWPPDGPCLAPPRSTTTSLTMWCRWMTWRSGPCAHGCPCITHHGAALEGPYGSMRLRRAAGKS